jgi:hypothetical protein
LAVDEKFGEVPLDISRAENASFGIFQEAVKGVGLGSVDLDFGEERKADAEILLAKGADFGLRAGFLRAELVAGEAQHGESAFFAGAVKLFQSSVLGVKPQLLAVLTISRTWP